MYPLPEAQPLLHHCGISLRYHTALLCDLPENIAAVLTIPLYTIIYTVTGDDGTDIVATEGAVDSILPVGKSTKVTGDFSGQNHAVAVGHFTDGSDQVILDTYV